jgi:hypothetical protein
MCDRFIRCFSRAQPTPDRSVDGLEDVRVGMLEVAEPAAQGAIEIGDDALEAVAPIASRFLPDRVLELVQALLAHEPLASLEPVTEELEPLPRHPAVADMRLRRMQRQAVRRDPRSNLGQRGVGVLARPAQDHEVVCVPHHPEASRSHQLVQRVEIDVGQQRADYALNAKDNLRLLTPPMGWISAAPRHEVV